MINKGIIIQGSARSKGNTNKIVQLISEKTGFGIVDLNTKSIGHFDYEFKNQDDDFLPLIKKIIDECDTIIFATPVYWYSMSGIMKVFFDRMSDLLKIEKETGRKLRGKNMGMVSCGSDAILQDGYTMPFIETANYLGMNYLGDVHTWIENEAIPEEVLENLESYIGKFVHLIR